MLLPALALSFYGAVAVGLEDAAVDMTEEQYRVVASRAVADHQDPGLVDYWREQESALERVYKESRRHCSPDDRTPATEFVIEISENGTLSRTFLPGRTDATKCAIDKLIGTKLGVPPRAPIYVRMFSSGLIICPGVPDKRTSRGRPPNHRLSPTVGSVTGLAHARPTPAPPAG